MRDAEQSAGKQSEARHGACEMQSATAEQGAARLVALEMQSATAEQGAARHDESVRSRLEQSRIVK